MSARGPRPVAPIVVIAMLALVCAPADVAGGQTTFETAAPAEVIATVTVRCDACAWETEGREAAVFAVTLNGRYVQHLPTVRPGRAEYRVLIGAVQPGTHTIRLDEDAALTARDVRGGHAVVESVRVQQIDDSAPEHRAVSLAPFVYARPDTVGRFTDVPVFMWYEVEPSPRGTRYRYSVIFTHEDGGTPTDRLMATWGRATDIEYLYSVEVDERGVILDEDMQGPEHEILPFRGRREGRHPLLWVSTINNMVLDSGSTSVRYGPAPIAFSLNDVSREAVMDAHPWLYQVMARELLREGRIVADAPPGKGTIPDPRHFVYLEACGEAGDAALAFSVRVGNQWLSSDRGMPEYRIVRDGCFRAAIPLPAGVAEGDLRVLRVQAFARPKRPGTAGARLTRVNTLFMLDEAFLPRPSVLSWQGSRALNAGGEPLDLPIP
jgi:hypothetical protein